MKKLFLDFYKITNLIKKKRLFVLFIILISSFLEFFTITLIIPILYSIFDPYILNNFLENKLNIQISYDLKYVTIILFMISFTIKIFLSLLFSYLLFKYTRDLKTSLSLKVLNFKLQKINNFDNKNISNFQKKIQVSVDYVVDLFIVPFFNFVAELIVIILLISLMFFIVGVKVIVPIVFIIFFSYTFFRFLSKKQKVYSNQINENLEICNTELKKIYDLSTDLILKNKKINFIKSYKITREKLNNAIMIFQTISRSSVILLELSGFILVSIILIVSIGDDIKDIIIKLSTFTAITFRLLPSFSRCNIAYNHINFSLPFIREISGLITDIAKERKRKRININSTLKLENIRFSYDNKKNFIFNETINLNKNTLIKGSNGKGKSTLLKLIFGIYKPQSGNIYLINKNLKREINNFEINSDITLVHQNSKIFEDTLLKNISMGTDKHDVKLLKKSIEIANINTSNLEMLIDEEGRNLSGGEKQKILIARAIYSKANLIVFDETFSSIDANSIKKIFSNLSKNKIKYFVISHNKNISNKVFEQIINLG